MEQNIAATNLYIFTGYLSKLSNSSMANVFFLLPQLYFKANGV